MIKIHRMLYMLLLLYWREIYYAINYYGNVFHFQDNPGENSAVLLILFPSPDSSRVTPQLYLSPRVEQWVFNYHCLNLPI